MLAVWENLTEIQRNARVSGLRRLGLSRFKDRKGLRYGRLLVVSFSGKNKYNQNLWLCQCDCGQKTVVIGHQLSTKRTTSCGCGRGSKPKHGKTDTPEYRMWSRCKTRAKRNGVPFTLTLEDIVIPPLCPVFHIPLTCGSREDNELSPSLDRIDNNKGYIKDNVWVISRKANTIKNNASLEELKALVAALESK